MTAPDLPALIAKAREPYLWNYCVVRGLVAALEAKEKERDALKTTLAELLIEYVVARKEGNIKDFPPRAQAIVRRAEAALGVEGK
jgi:hypothetical protein